MHWNIIIQLFRKTQLKQIIIITKQVLYFRMNRFEEALEYYDSAIQKNPEKADYYNNKAIALFQVGRLFYYIFTMNRFEEALEYYDSAIQKNPEKTEYYNDKANALFQIEGCLILEKMNRFEEAQEYFCQACQLDKEKHINQIYNEPTLNLDQN